MRVLVRTFIFVLVLSSQGLLANDQLVTELTNLRRSLNSNDLYRYELTLRLADALFDQAIEKGKNPAPTAAEAKALIKVQRSAVEEYQRALRGESGQAPQGAQKLKIQFQLARLYSDLKETNKATAQWKLLVNQNELLKLKREAALRLAEQAEAAGDHGSLGEAGRYYGIALDLCEEKDTCSYVHYRRSWLLRRQDKMSEAVEEVQKGLWDSKGQVRAEALRDLIVFLSLEKSDGKKALAIVEDLSNKLSDPQLVAELGAAFVSSGNKVAVINVLEFENSKRPTLLNEVRLFEEYYGQRSWEKFQETGERIASNENPIAEADKVLVENILRRLSVQLDGERASQKEHSGDFQQVAELYIKFFPTSKYTFNMMEGWLAAESDSQKKLDQMKAWAGDAKYVLTAKQTAQLRELRLAAAQREKNHTIVEEEARELASLNKGKEAAKFRFIQALALEQMEQPETALPLLQELAKSDDLPPADSLRSQQLALDILYKKKDYVQVVAQAESWTKNPKLQQTPEVKKALENMQATAKDAAFEQAAASGDTPEALQTFKKFCREKEFLPKSCENARVLAVKLKSQDTLIEVLQAQGKNEELANEYEAAGYFAKAAQQWEELQKKEKKVDQTQLLKTALLYELAGDPKNRDRLLNSLIAQLKQVKNFDETAPLVYQTLSDANLLSPALLELPWPEQVKLQVADSLEMAGKGNAKTQAILLASKKYAGEGWAKRVSEKLSSLDDKQKAIKFYGNNGQQKFERRLAALKQLSEASETYMEEVPSAFRVQILARLQGAYAGLAQEIEASPVPEGLDEGVVAQLQQSIQEMAAPFKERATTLAGLHTQEVEKLQEEEKPKEVARAEDAFFVQQALTQLHEAPSQKAPLSDLKKYYEDRGQTRIAAYFEGRLSQLNE